MQSFFNNNDERERLEELTNTIFETLINELQSKSRYLTITPDLRASLRDAVYKLVNIASQQNKLLLQFPAVLAYFVYNFLKNISLDKINYINEKLDDLQRLIQRKNLQGLSFNTIKQMLQQELQERKSRPNKQQGEQKQSRKEGESQEGNEQENGEKQQGEEGNEGEEAQQGESGEQQEGEEQHEGNQEEEEGETQEGEEGESGEEGEEQRSENEGEQGQELEEEGQQGEEEGEQGNAQEGEESEVESENEESQSGEQEGQELGEEGLQNEGQNGEQGEEQESENESGEESGEQGEELEGEQGENKGQNGEEGEQSEQGQQGQESEGETQEGEEGESGEEGEGQGNENEGQQGEETESENEGQSGEQGEESQEGTEQEQSGNEGEQGGEGQSGEEREGENEEQESGEGQESEGSQSGEEEGEVGESGEQGGEESEEGSQGGEQQGGEESGEGQNGEQGQESGGEEGQGNENEDILEDLENSIDEESEILDELEESLQKSLSALSIGEGSGGGILREVNPRVLDLLERANRMLALANQVDLEYANRGVKDQGGVMKGITTGNNLKHMFKSQLLLPDEIFLERYTNRALLQRAVENEGVGDLYFMIDKSGSMGGEMPNGYTAFENVSAVALASAMEAEKNNKKVFVQYFDDSTTEPLDVNNVFELAQTKPGGGTDMMVALRKFMEYYNNYPGLKDVKQIFILSDFETNYDKQTLQDFKNFARNNDLIVTCLHVWGDEVPNEMQYIIDEICDEYYKFNNYDASELFSAVYSKV
ncbi:MAG: hypothetical protein RXR18_03815 [Nitrososphaeria archaeon]